MIRPALLVAAILGLFAGCKSADVQSAKAPEFDTVTNAEQNTEPIRVAVTNADPKKVRFNAEHDPEIRAILDLANDDRWEEAAARADALLAADPTNSMVQRLQSWVIEQGRSRRQQALENEIRKVDAKNSAFNPTLPSLITEQKDRGLPPRKDVRDVIDRIESTPYIPESYGTVIRREEPVFSVDGDKGAMAKLLDKDISIHLDNVPLETVILNLSQSAGVNMVADKAIPALKQVLTVNLDHVKLGEFFRYLGRNYDLQFQVGQDIVWVVDGKDPKQLMEETRFYRLRKGFVLPAQLGADETVKTTVIQGQNRTETEVQKFNKFVNDEAPAAPSIERVLTNLFNGSKIMIDYERNLVVARGTPEQLEVVEKVIKEFDQPIQQVLIEARFVTLSKPAFLQLGVLWETGRRASAAMVPQDYTGLIGGVNVANLGVGIQEVFTNVLDRQDLTATISALEQSGESQTLSAPRLTVLNNRPATISDGKVQYFYEEYNVKTTVQQYYTASSFVPAGKPTKITSGAELNVMASIAGDGKSMILALNPRVNTDVQLTKFASLSDYDAEGKLQSTFDINLPQYRTQELATRVVVKSGQTVVMGGVLEHQKSTFVESVPVLGSIPYLGALFRRRTEVDTPRYLLVFVTATILNESGQYIIYDEEPKQSAAQ